MSYIHRDVSDDEVLALSLSAISCECGSQLHPQLMICVSQLYEVYLGLLKRLLVLFGPGLDFLAL